MKKILLGACLTASLGLVGCGSDETLEEIREETATQQPFARIVFDPANADLNIPNDLLMLPATDNFFDFTIELEADPFDPSDPEQALGALDGWSTTYPFSINVELPDGVDIDPATVTAGAIRIFEATQALEGDSAVCLAIADAAGAPGIPCELGDELTFGVDFVASYTAGTGAISVVPLHPLKAAQGYMLVVTEELRDNQTPSRAVRGSTTWDLARLDIDTQPLATDDQLQLQGLVNLLLDPLESVGLESTDVSYAAYFSTQSVGTVLGTVKQLQIAGFAQAFVASLAAGADQATALQTAAQYLPAIVATSPESDPNAFEVLAPFFFDADSMRALEAVGLDSCEGLITTLADPTSDLYETAASTFATAGPFCAAKRVEGQINLPYYLSTSEPLTERWRAACTNGAMLQILGEDTISALVAAEQVGDNNALCQAASGGQLFDLNLSSLGISDERHLTKVSPIPVAQGRNEDDTATLYNEAGTETLDVQFTVPDEAVIAVISAATGGAVSPVTKPDAGWPVVIFQHGLSGSKENALIVSAVLSLAGYATVAIDQPLHSGRAIVDAEGITVDASENPTYFLNLSSMLTGRDNARQGASDILGLRLGLNAIVDTSGDLGIDTSSVYFAGQSLGTVTGAVAVANANTTLGGDLAAFDDMYRIQGAFLNVPSSGISATLLESATFSTFVKASVTEGSSDDFVAFVEQYAAATGVSYEEALVPAYLEFEASLSEQDLAELNSTFNAFAFAAQTVIDSSDPVNYAQRLTATETPTLIQVVVGGGVNDDGSTALTDQVNPVSTSLPLFGSQAFADIAGIPKVSSTTEGSGIVRFITGGHPSLLLTEPSVATFTEMQSQMSAFFATGNIVVTDTSLVEN